jgi:cobalamin-dependent methionine synthase I
MTNTLFLSGLEVVRIESQANFINIGERTNVAGSIQFKRAIQEKDYVKAIAIARERSSLTLTWTTRSSTALKPCAPS